MFLLLIAAKPHTILCSIVTTNPVANRGTPSVASHGNVTHNSAADQAKGFQRASQRVNLHSETIGHW